MMWLYFMFMTKTISNSTYPGWRCLRKGDLWKVSSITLQLGSLTEYRSYKATNHSKLLANTGSWSGSEWKICVWFSTGGKERHWSTWDIWSTSHLIWRWKFKCEGGLWLIYINIWCTQCIVSISVVPLCRGELPIFDWELWPTHHIIIRDMSPGLAKNEQVGNLLARKFWNGEECALPHEEISGEFLSLWEIYPLCWAIIIFSDLHVAKCNHSPTSRPCLHPKLLTWNHSEISLVWILMDLGSIPLVYE